MSNFKYRAICHTKCYWFDTLWEIGEVYEGDIEPNEHFSLDGKKDPGQPPPDAGRDPRSNQQLREDLKKTFNFTAPLRWTRKQLWSKLFDLEALAERDKLTASMPEKKFEAMCGFEAKSNAGVQSHERTCSKCQEKLNNGNPS